MKNNNDYRWVPCNSWFSELPDRCGDASSAQELLRCFATSMSLELLRGGASVGLRDFASKQGDDYPPVIEIG